ncbi:hypothetical protein V8G54_027943 [Vigna mungo]|uniref:Uncharacterized protein n=1 Tax=Vigna mungo TaxID=3915 RepID=A0AAQ3MR39_VIGMU
MFLLLSHSVDWSVGMCSGLMDPTIFFHTFLDSSSTIIFDFLERPDRIMNSATLKKFLNPFPFLREERVFIFLGSSWGIIAFWALLMITEFSGLSSITYGRKEIKKIT